QTADPCMPNTRLKLLDDVQSWVREDSGARVFWLDGMAGTGKSAIARSVSNALRDNKRLGGSFFCSRGTRDDVKRIIPTLAMSLARHDPLYRLALLDVLEKNPDVAHAKLVLQVKHLLEEPLRNAYGDTASKWVLVMDALDECVDGAATRDMLSEVINCSRHLPIKFFITSRPERHIRGEFESTESDLHNILRLHDVAEDLIQSDIRFYITHRLADIRASWEKQRLQFPSQWPSEDDVAKLTKQAGKLFIYAFTAMIYIAKANPMKRLEGLTKLAAILQPLVTEPLDQMYSFVLANALDPKECTEDEIRDTKRMLTIILVMREPLSVSALSELIGQPAQEIRVMLERLHAVVYTPSQDISGAITTFHTSFEDYLTTPNRAPENFQLKTSDGHRSLADASIRIMASKALHFNVLGCRTSYKPDSEQDLAPISVVLAYSCIHWPHHLTRASDTSALSALIEGVLREKLLFWIEAVLSVGGTRLVSSLLGLAMSVVRSSAFTSRSFAQLLRDANTFVVSCRQAMDIGTPHMYLSALPSEPCSSTIAQMFWPKFPNITRIQAAGASSRRKQYLHIEHTAAIESVAFSPDGTRIVSGSLDNTIRLWDATTGNAVMQPLEGHTEWITSVAFSPDGTRIVSGSADKTIRLWDATTGNAVMQPLEGHTEVITSVAFSFDGTRIVSGSVDTTIRLWDATTGNAVMQPLEGHTERITSVAFSPDGTRIVSGSYDKTIRLWDATTGNAVMQPLEGHSEAISSVAFSPDGTRIVSGSYDNTIRLWDATTGNAVTQPLEGHTAPIISVAFSPDGTRIVSESQDNTIRLWDVTTGIAVMQPLEGHTEVITSVAFSFDGTRIVSGSVDNTIRLWDATTGNAVMQPLEGHTERITSVAFSPDGTRIVSGSKDKTIRLWDATTGNAVMQPLEGHTERITSVAFSPDGTRIVSGSFDKTIRCWSADTRSR
ncbi:hypothetical protein CERSUDRAFT_18643, partial [Gelatoporia subvermispora B]